MEIMDDILDLADLLGEKLEKGRRATRRALRGEGGFSTLVTVLVILALGAMIITPLLVWVITGQRAGEAHERVTHRFYAADAGIQDGMYRIATGDIPDEWLGTWDDSVYDADPIEYTLPEQMNDCDVTVKLRPMWLLAGLEDPSYGREPHGELVTVSNIVGGGSMQIVIVSDNPGNYKLTRIGVWIPEGFTYTMGSSNIEELSPTDPAYCEPTVSEWRNGHTIIFEYATAVDFVDFPGVTGNRMVITFDYEGTGTMATSWSWCRTSRMDIYLSWSGDIKLYQVESTATDPDTGLSTTVIAGNMTNESVGTYLAFYGDYTTTGNALMRETGTDRVRDRLYEESPGEISDIPTSGTARKILLYWSGWKESPDDAWYGNTSKDVSTWPTEDQAALQLLADTYCVNQVSLRVEYEGYSYDLGVIDASEWTVLPNGSAWSPNGWSYGCNADITDLVLTTLPDDFVGNATYWVGHADLGGESLPSDETLQGIWGSADNDIYIVGNTGTVLHYNLSTWETQDSETSRNLRGVWGSDNTHIWAVGASSAIQKYTGTWADQSRSDGRSETLNGVWGSSATDVWIVGDRFRTWDGQYRHTILHTTDGGTNWTNDGYSITSAQDLNGIWGSDSSHVYAVGTSGRIMRYNGSAWGTMSSGTTRELYGVWGTAWNNVYAVGASGTILRYNGTSWSSMSSGTTQTLYGIWGSAEDDIYAVGAGGTIQHYNGTSWSDVDSGTNRNLYGAWGTSSTNVYVVGEATSKASTILHWDGSEWAAVGGGTGLWGWHLPHSGDTSPTVTTDYPLSDVVNNEWANACWSVITLYTSPVTLAHQMYLFDTFRYWNSNDDVTFTLDGFLAPASVASEDDAVKLTYFVGEGDSWYGNGDNVYVNGTRLNPSYINPATCAPINNAMNSTSNSGGITGYLPDDGIDLDTYSIDGSSGIIKPADSSATVRLTTGTDVWNMMYMILSFRSDTVGTGLLTYIVL
ncbi:MAG: hypothetical protein JW753_05765 [Dehalococcoidia bacterium]|nr:hypothetical protein [Dehalococcoidia bacterium]